MKYTETTVRNITKHLKQGLSAKESAALSGISEDTYHTWKKEKPEFSESVKRAKAAYVNSLLQNINKAGKNDWRASAWLLERRYPKEYSLRWLEKNSETEVVNVALVEFIGGKPDRIS